MDLDNNIANGGLAPQEKKEVAGTVGSPLDGNLVSRKTYDHEKDAAKYSITDQEMEIGGQVYLRVHDLVDYTNVDNDISVQINKTENGVSLRIMGSGEVANSAHNEARGITKMLLGVALASGIRVKDTAGKEVRSLKEAPFSLTFDNVGDLARVVNAVTLEESKKIPLPHSVKRGRV